MHRFPDRPDVTEGDILFAERFAPHGFMAPGAKARLRNLAKQVARSLKAACGHASASR